MKCDGAMNIYRLKILNFTEILDFLNGACNMEKYSIILLQKVIEIWEKAPHLKDIDTSR